VRGAVLSGLGLLTLLTACKQTDCEQLERAPVAGTYKGGGSLGEDRLLRVGLTASSQQVELTWTMMDGSRIRATYRVAKQRKEP
jgi:hypothetical protein